MTWADLDTIREKDIVRYKGAEYSVVELTPNELRDLRVSASLGMWFDVQKAALLQLGSNPIFNGAIGMYNNVVIHMKPKPIQQFALLPCPT